MAAEGRKAGSGAAARSATDRAGAATGEPAAAGRDYAPLLDVLRIAAILGVITVHVAADHVTPESPASMLVLRSLLATAVPAFVMVSGALNLAPAAMRHGSGAFLTRRLRRLLPAAVVWTAFYALVMNVLLSPAPSTPGEEIAALLTASTYPHLYFLPLIIGLTMISPVLAAYVADSARRTWLLGGAAAVWALCVTAMPYLTAGLLGQTIAPVQLGALTYFVPYIGYYLLGRAAWAHPPGRHATRALLLCVPPLTALAVWAYASPLTDSPPGQALLPTYLAPSVMPLALALVIGLLSSGRRWRVGRRAEQWLRRTGDAAFGVFLIHFAILVLLRGAGFPETSAPEVVALISLVTVMSFGLTVVGKRIPVLREVL